MVPAIVVSALLTIVVMLPVVALGWFAFVLAVRRAVDTSGTSRKLEQLAEEVRLLRRELRERDAGLRNGEAKGHQVDRSV